MSRKVFNAKYAADAPGPPSDWDDDDIDWDDDEHPIGDDDEDAEFNIPGLGKIKSEAEQEAEGNREDYPKDKILLTNNPEFVKRHNQGPKIVTEDYVPRLEPGGPDRRTVTRKRWPSPPPLNPAPRAFLMTPEEANERGVEIMPELTDAERAEHSSLDSIRSRETLPTENERIKAIPAAMNIISGQTAQHGCLKCDGYGTLLEGPKVSICPSCDGNGHSIADGASQLQNLQYSAGKHNEHRHAHKHFCDGECFDGCEMNDIVEPFRQAWADVYPRLPVPRSVTHYVDGESKQAFKKIGRPELADQLRRVTSPISLEDDWSPTAPGLIKRMNLNNLEGPATTTIRPGDICGYTGGHDPRATILIHSTNSDGTHNGFLNEIPRQGMQMEIGERRSRAMKGGLTQQMITEAGMDAFNSAITKNPDWNSHRDIMAGLAGELRSLTRNPYSLLKTNPTHTRWVENVPAGRLYRHNTVTLPASQYMGSVYQTMPWSSVRDSAGQRFVKKNGQPYADTTYAGNVRSTRVMRGPNPWSLPFLWETANSMGKSDHREKLLDHLVKTNQSLGVGSSAINSNLPDMDHPLNVVPPNVLDNATVWTKRGELVIPDHVKEAYKKSSSDYYSGLSADAGGKPIKLEEPGRLAQDQLSKPGYREFLRKSLESHVGRALSDEEYGDAENAFATFGSMHDAKRAIDPFYKTPDEEDEI